MKWFLEHLGDQIESIREIVTAAAIAFFVGVCLGVYRGKLQPPAVSIQSTAITQTDIHKVQHKIETKKPDGTVKIETFTTSDLSKDSVQQQTKVVTVDHKKYNLSLLAPSIELKNSGISFTTEVLGPVTLGVYYLNNFGFSIGVNF